MNRRCPDTSESQDPWKDRGPQESQDNPAIRQRDLDFFVAAKGVLRCNNHSFAPNDAAGRTASFGVNSHHGRCGVIGGWANAFESSMSSADISLPP